MVVKYRHVSDPNNTLYEIKGIRDIEVGKNSTFTAFNNNLVFDVVYEGDTVILEIKPSANELLIESIIRITDNNDIKCYFDVSIYVSQNCGIWIPTHVDAFVTDDCCDDKGNIKMQVYNGIEFEISDWIDTIKVYEFEPLIEAYKVKGQNKIIICSYTCFDLYNIPIYVCGYDKECNLISEVTIYVNLIHDDIEPEDRGKLESKDDYEKVCPPLKGGGPGGGIDPDDPTTFPPGVTNPSYDPDDDDDNGDDDDDDDERCILKLQPSQIIVNHEDIDNFKDGVIKYKAYTATKSTLKIEGGGKTITVSPLKSNGEFDISEMVREIFGDSNKDKETQYIYVSIDGDCKEELTVECVKENYNPNEPALEVYPDDTFEPGAKVMPDGTYIHFYKDNKDGGCPDTWYTKYDVVHILTVESGTSSWYVNDYDFKSINCRKIDDVTLAIQLLDYEEISCADAKTIVIANSDGDMFTIHYTVGKGMVRRDEYVFQWVDTPIVLADKNDIPDPNRAKSLTKICENYYDSNITNRTFYLESWYSLALEANTNNSVRIGNWSFMSKVVNYKIEEYINDAWRPITNYNVTNIPTTRRTINVYVQAAPENPQLGDIRITTESTFTQDREGYIDFIQSVTGNQVRLRIKHPPVVKYDIYTDQVGKVNVDITK